MPGYSGTPLPQKLGVKPGQRIALVQAPGDLHTLLGELPSEAHLQHDLRGSLPLDLIVLFARDRASLQARFPRAEARLANHGGLWIAWPKKSSGLATDLGESDVRAIGLASGLVDNKVCAVTDIWSGLRFVRRLRDRR